MPTLSEQRKEKSDLMTGGYVLLGIPTIYLILITVLNYFNYHLSIIDNIPIYYPLTLVLIGSILYLVGRFKKISEA
jgi:hypothetical protein